MLKLALTLAILAASPASAAQFGELPFQPLQSPARCLQATGVPGELVRWAPDGVEVFQATRSGFGPPAHVVLGEASGVCPIVVSQPSGAALIVQQARDNSGLEVAVREPGGDWHTQALPDTPGHLRNDVDAAVSARGDAVIGWQDVRDGGSGTSHRVLVMRRPAGGTFGAPVELKMTGLDSTDVELGIAGDGTTLALLHNAPRLVFTTAPLGGPFGPPQTVTSGLEGTPRLTVAPDGRALALVPASDTPTRIFERPPAGAFAPVGDIRFADTSFGDFVLALRPDGGAIVAWKDFDSQVLAVRRDGPGGFHVPEKVGAKPADPFVLNSSDGIGDDVPSDLEGRYLQAAFAPDGRPVLTWSPKHTTGLLNWASAAVTTFGGDAQMLGGPLRDADSIAPVILADGTPAVAWSDVSSGGDPHLHLAIEGAVTAPDPPAPRIRLGRVEQLRKGGLALPFRCSAACDVRATVPGGANGRHSLRAPGSSRLTINPVGEGIVLRRPDSVPVQVLTGASGARSPGRVTLTARLRFPRLPRMLGLKAVRRGKRVVVTWHGDRPLSGASVVVMSSRTRAPVANPVGKVVHGKRQRRFRVATFLEPGDRYIQLYLIYEPDVTQRRVAAARITGLRLRMP
jgi:hypothetical protein